MEMEKLSEEAVWFQYDEVMLVFQLFIPSYTALCSKPVRRLC